MVRCMSLSHERESWICTMEPAYPINAGYSMPPLRSSNEASYLGFSIYAISISTIKATILIFGFVKKHCPVFTSFAIHCWLPPYKFRLIFMQCRQYGQLVKLRNLFLQTYVLSFTDAGHLKKCGCKQTSANDQAQVSKLVGREYGKVLESTGISLRAG